MNHYVYEITIAGWTTWQTIRSVTNQGGLERIVTVAHNLGADPVTVQIVRLSDEQLRRLRLNELVDRMDKNLAWAHKQWEASMNRATREYCEHANRRFGVIEDAMILAGGNIMGEL